MFPRVRLLKNLVAVPVARGLHDIHLEVVRVWIWRLETRPQLHLFEQTLGEENLDHQSTSNPVHVYFTREPDMKSTFPTTPTGLSDHSTDQLTSK